MNLSEKNKSSAHPGKEEQDGKSPPYCSLTKAPAKGVSRTNRRKENGVHKPNKEDILCLLLHRGYSSKQLRKIKYLLRNKYGRSYLSSSLLRSTICFSVPRQIIIKRAFEGVPIQ